MRVKLKANACHNATAVTYLEKALEAEDAAFLALKAERNKGVAADAEKFAELEAADRSDLLFELTEARRKPRPRPGFSNGRRISNGFSAKLIH